MKTFWSAVFVLGNIVAFAGVANGQGIAVGDLLAANYAGGAVWHYDGQTGQSFGPLITALQGPTGLAFLANSDLAVAESQRDRILRYDGITGAFKGSICASGINNPRGISLGADANLWVAALDDDSVVCLDPDTGQELRRLSVWHPMGVATGNGRVYVTTQSFTVRQFDLASGADLGILAQSFGTSLEAIVTAPDGAVIVNCTTPGLVRIDWQTGVVLATCSGFGGEGLAVGNDGQLYARRGGPPAHLAAVDPVSLQVTGQAVQNYEGTHGIIVKPIPEPATLALLGVSWILLLKRRRKPTARRHDESVEPAAETEVRRLFVP
jgi:outer membrane protein assembly factor BamB